MATRRKDQARKRLLGQDAITENNKRQGMTSLGEVLKLVKTKENALRIDTQREAAITEIGQAFNGWLQATTEEPGDSGKALAQMALTVWSVGAFFANGGRSLRLLDTDVNADAWKGKLTALAGAEQPAALLIAPGCENANNWDRIKEFCGRTDLGDAEGEPFCFAILDTDCKEHKPAQGASLGDTRTAAFGPWVKMGTTYRAGQGRGQYIMVPASPMVAGVIARTDGEQGPHYAAAGNDAVVRGAQGLTTDLTDNEVGSLNSAGINCLRRFPGEGSVLVWGTRTLSTEVPYRYITTSRMLMMIRRTCKKQMRSVVFKPNTEGLRKQLDRDITSYLKGLVRREQIVDFRVICNETNNPVETVDRGELHIRIEVAVVKPAEFVVVEVAQLQQAE